MFRFMEDSKSTKVALCMGTHGSVYINATTTNGNLKRIHTEEACVVSISDVLAASSLVYELGL